MVMWMVLHSQNMNVVERYILGRMIRSITMREKKGANKCESLLSKQGQIYTTQINSNPLRNIYTHSDAQREKRGETKCKMTAR